MKNFALTGAAGYIAPRHLQAIRDTGNNLVAAVDPHDSVGILDRYFPDTSFFTEYERFDRHLEKLKRGPESDRVHYISICSPNNLHDAHIRTALRVGADALCEKPLVLNPWNLDVLQELETEYERRVWTVLQLRVHPSLIELHDKLRGEAGKKGESGESGEAGVKSKRHKVRLTYLTSRGTWYRFSWKGDHSRSGGIATNIGIHFFDMLIWLFGSVQHSWLHLSEPDKMAGFLELENADVEWYLGIDRNDLPAGVLAKGQTTYRSITVDGREIEFSGGFTDLHTRVYEATLAGNGFGISDARPSIELVQGLRTSAVQPERGERHIMLQA
ncbi:MAG: Gfo/Idh/MocA family oxidoreductase [Cyclonatronaceae bacterium]